MLPAPLMLARKDRGGANHPNADARMFGFRLVLAPLFLFVYHTCCARRQFFTARARKSR